MAGTVQGGKLAAETIKKKYGPGFYVKIGAEGGKISRGGGYASDIVGKDGLTGRERAVINGSKGGKAKKRVNNEAHQS